MNQERPENECPRCGFLNLDHEDSGECPDGQMPKDPVPFTIQGVIDWANRRR